MSKPQIFCFTYAGGDKNFFSIIEEDLKEFDLVSFDYAGHGERHKEEFYQDFDELADDMFREAQDKISGKYALFGYSMGSITATEVLRRIVSTGLPLPSHVFLCSHEPHTKSELLGFSADELDEWVKERTIRFGDVPEKLLTNKVFWRTYLPIYRADYTIIGKYKFEDLDLRTDVPLTVFYSETDTPLEDMKQWQKFFIGSVDYQRYEGNHFFIREHHREMAEVIRNRLMPEQVGVKK